MNSTLSDIKQMFNVTKIASATTIDAMVDGEIGIFPEGVDTSVAATVDYLTLPAKFKIISKLNGKVYTSFDTIEKSKMFNQISKAYKAETVNIWKVVIENCSCIEGVVLNIGIDEQSLIQRDGLTWTHKDFLVVVTPEELLCKCSCDGTDAVYENHLITELLYNKVNALKSPFYEAEVQLADGTPFATPADLATYIAANKTVNTDALATNNTEKLTLVIKGKKSSPRQYRDLEVNYVYPRGVRLNPSVSVNSGAKNIAFTQVAPLVYELGAGYDLRAEEFENMNYYTNLNFYPVLSDGIASQNLVYQFENNTNYSVVNFEFFSKKSGLQDVPEGEHKKFGVLLATKTPAVFAKLVSIFVP